MAEAQPTIDAEIERYLRTGESDPHYGAWTGSFMDRVNRAHEDLRGAVVHEVRSTAQGLTQNPLPAGDTVALTRAKVEPMVCGLFPRAEQDTVLKSIEQSVVFVTTANIESLLLGSGFDSSAWTLAKPVLGKPRRRVAGEGRTAAGRIERRNHLLRFARVLLRGDPFTDFIVHEAAHIFHNCRRATIGLHETRTKVWLLDICYGKRETFAYSCEAYARVLQRGTNPAERRALSEECAGECCGSPTNERMPPRSRASSKLLPRLGTAGRVILARCAPTRTAASSATPGRPLGRP